MRPAPQKSLTGVRGAARLTAVAVALLATCSVVRTDGQTASPALKRLLADPLSPVTVARLLAHAESPDAVNRLREALAHEGAQVRAAAARVVFVAGLASLEDPLAAALDVETAPDAAYEQSRALAHLAGPRHDARILDAWRRTAAINIPLALAAARGPSALALIPGEPTLRDGRLPLATFIRVAARDDATLVAKVASDAVGQRDTQVFGAALRAARDTNVPLPDEIIVSALQETSTPELGRIAIWHLLDGQDPPVTIAEKTRDAVLAFVSAVPAQTPRTIFQHEIAARAAGRPPRDDDEWMTLLNDRSQSLEGEATRRGPRLLLTQIERDALARTYGIEFSRLSMPLAAVPRSASRAAPWLRSAAGYPDGLAASIFPGTGCVVSRARTVGQGAAESNLTLRANGSVARVSGIDPLIERTCTEAIGLLMALYTAAPDRLLTQGDLDGVLIPFMPEYVACQAATPVGTSSFLWPDEFARSGIPKPVVRKRVEPSYPPRALQRGVEGRVTVDLTVTKTGCVSDAAVFGASGSGLERAALMASLQWQFAPLVVDGEARDIRVRIEFRFELERPLP